MEYYLKNGQYGNFFVYLMAANIGEKIKRYNIYE